MLQTLIRVHLVLPLLAFAPAPEEVEPPRGPSPELQMVSGFDAEKGTLTVVVTSQKPVTKQVEVTEIVTVGDKKVAVRKVVPVTEFVSVTVSMAYNLNDKKVSATDVNGNKLTREALGKLVSPGKSIAVVRDVNGLDPVYRSALARDVAVLVVPPPTRTQGDEIRVPRPK